MNANGVTAGVVVAVAILLGLFLLLESGWPALGLYAAVLVLIGIGAQL